MNLSVIILTFNEVVHIRRCIERLRPLARDIFVVDCFSTDGTAEVAREYGVQVVQNVWPGNQSDQFNWALANLPIQTKWVLRLDADEYLCPELVREIESDLERLPQDVMGVIFKRRHIFMGKWVRRGVYPVRLLRLFQYGKARCERRWMDEHLELLEGRAVEMENDFVDHNLNDIGWWTAKHNGYALREAAHLLDSKYGLFEVEKEIQGATCLQRPQAKRALKNQYAKLPLFLRAFLYFLLRYVVRGGFLDGKEGFLWHFLQGWWYRTLVDAKVWEIQRESGGDRERMRELLRGKYGIKI